MPDINQKVRSATKWSTVTEIVSKLVSPLSTMALARILTPEAFGVLVTATMVISFAEIFTDAGFQKYLIQKNFSDDDSLFKSTSVAFWSNLLFSLVIWLGIVVFSSQIATMVGNEGYGCVIAVSCVCIPLAAFSSIQMALFKRKLDFKTLFQVRIIGILIPIVVTIPLALVLRSYWALIIGMIALNLSNAALLTIKSEWKPRWFYDFKLFKEMFSFTMWTLIESVSIWLTGYLDVFIVGSVLSTYHMGIYRTSINTVGQIMAIVTSATTPVLFSALSRLQDDDNQFREMFFKFQKLVGLLVIPMGVGIYLFSDLITKILLGNQWLEASSFIGLWGLTSSITIILSHYSSEIYRSKGKPKWSFFSQILHLLFLIPTVLISIRYSFETLYVSRSLIRFQGIIVNLILVYQLVRITPIQLFSNIKVPIIASAAMCAICFIKTSDDLFVQFAYIAVCIAVYFGVVMLFPTERSLMLNMKNIIMRRNK